MHTSANTVSRFQGSSFMQVLTSFLLSCTFIHHHRLQGPTLFRRVRWDFTFVQCDVCAYTGPPVLSPIRKDQVIYSISITQGDCSRINAGSGNRTSVPVPAQDHKSNSLQNRRIHSAFTDRQTDRHTDRQTNRNENLTPPRFCRDDNGNDNKVLVLRNALHHYENPDVYKAKKKRFVSGFKPQNNRFGRSEIFFL